MGLFIRCLWAASLFILAKPALANPPDRVSILLGSRHVGTELELEETNPGIFLDWERPGGVTFSAGAYRNSFGRISVAGMAGYSLYRRPETRIDVFAGLAHYPGQGHKTRLSVGELQPLAGLRLEHRGAFLLAIPGDGDTVRGLLAFGFSVDLNR